MKTGVLKNYQLLPLIGYLRVPLLQKQNLARKSSSCKRDEGLNWLGHQRSKSPNLSYQPSKKIYIFYNCTLMLTLKMFQGTSNLTTSDDPDRLLALKEHLILCNWKNHFPCCQKKLSLDSEISYNLLTWKYFKIP